MSPNKNKKKVQKNNNLSKKNHAETESELIIQSGTFEDEKRTHDPFVYKGLDEVYVLVINGFEYRWRGRFKCGKTGCERAFHVNGMEETPFESLAYGLRQAQLGHKRGCELKNVRRQLSQMYKVFLSSLGGKFYDATEDVVPVYNTKQSDREKVQKSKKLQSPVLKDNDEIITGQLDAMNISGSSKMNKDVNKEGMDVRPNGAQDDLNGIVSEESEETAVSTSSGDATLATSPYSSWSNRDASYAPTASSPDSSFAWGELIHDE